MSMFVIGQTQWLSRCYRQQCSVLSGAKQNPISIPDTRHQFILLNRSAAMEDREHYVVTNLFGFI